MTVDLLEGSANHRALELLDGLCEALVGPDGDGLSVADAGRLRGFPDSSTRLDDVWGKLLQTDRLVTSCERHRASHLVGQSSDVPRPFVEQQALLRVLGQSQMRSLGGRRELSKKVVCKRQDLFAPCSEWR